ncbi:hypothetical protein B7L70_02630 [Vulcanisaeta sp. EB80]|uniref:hypothetical protein n=1 Tax=Vulcanisaeta sp. EB80 TaxID=1650660 RepID=UPI0007466F4E|nr:hypothetical protein [Vulcanisaeta sp. EB80]KUO91122.1 MAG: hypothetical protein AT713_02415 [Caldivirga sp. JCHS_4]MCG2865844.1 hypothetical protein [Vulcanisaeta sp.]PLC68548.1 hypothetical protein B7L70_02630 [Vulcanisaeta sp. EB80]
MAYFDIDTACREGFGDRKLVAMIQQRISSLDEDLDQGEQEFLVSYAYQDLRYYLLYKFGLFNLDNNDASYELCKRIIRNEDSVVRLVDEWFNWWVIKWRQRVRLVFNESEQKGNETGESQSIEDLIKKIPKRLLDKLRRETMIELMRQNEVCSLDIVSDFIVRSALNDLINEYSKDGALRVLVTDMTEVRMRILRKIMEISSTNKPLVILKVKINSPQPYQGMS